MSEGEFHFTLTEKRDRNGQMYLFAGIRMLNSVVFVRPEPLIPGEPQRWAAVLKPYRPKGADDTYEEPWIQSDNNPALSVQQGESNDDDRSTKASRRPR